MVQRTTIALTLCVVSLCTARAHASSPELRLGADILHAPGSVVAVRFMADGTLASVDHSPSVCRWDSQTGGMLSCTALEGARAGRVIALSDEGHLVATLSERPETPPGAAIIELRDARTGRVLLSLPSYLSEPSDVALHGDRIATADRDGLVRLFDGATGKLLAELSPRGSAKLHISKLPPRRGMHSVSFSPDGARVAGGHGDGNVHVWDTLSGELLASFDSGAPGLRPAWSPDGRRLAWLHGGQVHTAELARPEEVTTLVAGQEYLRTVAFSPDGEQIAAGTGLNNAYLWCLDQPDHPVVIRAHGGAVGALAFSADGLTLATGGGDHAIGLWDTATGEDRLATPRHFGRVDHIAASPDGEWIATSGVDGTVRLWDGQTGEPRLVLRNRPRFIKPWSDAPLAIAPDGGTVFGAITGGDLVAWDVASGEVRWRRASAYYSDMAVCPDGSSLAVISNYGAVQLLDTATGALQGAFSQPGAWSKGSVAWATGGRLVVAGAEGTISIWSPQNESTAQVPDVAAGSYQVVSSAEGAWVVTGAYGGLRLWRPVDGSLELVGELASGGAMAISADGSVLAAAAEGGEITIRRLPDGKTVRTLSGHSTYVTAVAIHAAGARVISGDGNGVVLVHATDMDFR